MEPLSPTAPVFRLWNGKGAPMIRIDLEAAGIPYRDECGRVDDFHALRHIYGTLLNKAGVPLVTTQRLMRHGDLKLTANIYTHVLIQTKAEAIAKLPELVAGTDEAVAEPGKTVVIPAGSFCTDHEAKITIYGDGENEAKQVFSAMPKHEKATVSQGKTGALMTGTRSATRTQDLLIKSETDGIRNIIFDKASPQAEKARTVQRTVSPDNQFPSLPHDTTAALFSDLAAIVAAWPSAPEPIRAAVMAVLAPYMIAKE